MSGQFPSDAAWERVDPSVPLPRDRPPPVPAGLSRCDGPTRACWQSSNYRFPPYQFQLKYLMTDYEGNLRTVSPTERERLMGLGPGAIQFCFNAGEAKRHPRAYEDKRLSLLGDGFAMLSFAWVCGQACKPWATCLFPTALIQRFGLALVQLPLSPGLR